MMFRGVKDLSFSGPDELVLFFPMNDKETTWSPFFYSSNHQKWLPYQILGGKTIKK